MQLPNCKQPPFDPVSPGAAAVGIFLVVATALAVLPQVVLLLRTRSSEGVSVLTPALALSFGYLNLCSTTLVKWPALLSIGHNALQLLDFMQQAASALGLAVILLLVVMYKPNHGRAKRLGAAALLAVLVAIGVALCLLSAHAPCSELTMSIASAASVASGVMVVIAFIPQLYETWRTRGRGSLSYVYYAIQSVGCLLVVGFQLFGLRDPWPVWAPPLVGGVIQGLVVVLGVACLCCSTGRSGAVVRMSSREHAALSYQRYG